MLHAMLLILPAKSCKTFVAWLVFSTFVLIAGCGGGDSGSSSSSAETIQQSGGSNPVEFQSLGLQIVSDDEWDDTAVRKVLHTFAYGGHATDSQIKLWADIPPSEAIVQILTFDEHNLLLSPLAPNNADDLDKQAGTLHGLANFWSSDDQNNGIYKWNRGHYLVDQQIEKIWLRAATSRGLNPFRQKIGLWETNYHMAVNLDASVTPKQVARYYDDIMESLENNPPYQDVIANAASSAAVAVQYGHRKNRYVNGICVCNEDFAREFYQLFYGITGNYSPYYHETVTIKNMAKSLSDMRVWDFEDDVVTFGTEYHYPDSLEMLFVEYWGSTALDRIKQVSQDAINNAESLDNLPVMIIRDLADDNLDDNKIAQIHSAWSSMQTKKLLDFIRAYAVSDIFHSDSRIKYLSSIDRDVLIANKIILSNRENYLDIYNKGDYKNEEILVFHPTHNVFGNQTGMEASSSASVFIRNYNDSTLFSDLHGAAYGYNYGQNWEKDWGSVIPESEAGQYVVKGVSEWLWNHFIGDGLKRLGVLERAHLYALLAFGRDIGSLPGIEETYGIVTRTELETEPQLIGLMHELASEILQLDSDDKAVRRYANERIGLAINFIISTPYTFIQEGK